MATRGFIADSRRGLYDGAATLPPSWVLDAAAQRQITGGYKIHKSNICSACHMARFGNGSCYCI